MTRIAPTPQNISVTIPNDIADDLMTTAREISVFLYGNASKEAVRRTRYAIKKRIIPTFKWNGLVAARKSKIRRTIEKLEAAAEDRK